MGGIKNKTKQKNANRYLPECQAFKNEIANETLTVTLQEKHHSLHFI